MDDEDGPRQSLAVIFKDEYNLLMADDVRRPSLLAQNCDIDVALLDIRMAGMSGISAGAPGHVKPDMEADHDDGV